jgi:hypothetical protein
LQQHRSPARNRLQQPHYLQRSLQHPARSHKLRREQRKSSCLQRRSPKQVNPAQHPLQQATQPVRLAAAGVLAVVVAAC